jgi:hypothetical protein
MEILGALVIIAAIVAIIVWLLMRRPGDTPAPAPPKAITDEQIREIVRSNIKIEITSAPAGPRYDAEEYPMQAVGESYNQAAIRSIAEAHPERGQLEDSAVCAVRATLIPETDNQHDANAVRVEIEGKKVGYLSRADAARYRSASGPSPASIAALIVGGWDRGGGDRGHYGVRLALKTAGATQEDIPAAPGLMVTPGAFRYDVNGIIESCSTLTAVGETALIEVRLVPVPEEQRVDVIAGDLVLGSIHGVDAQVVIRAGGVTGVPARVFVRKSYDPSGGNYARLNRALRIDRTSIPREHICDGCARTPGVYGQHVQAVHKHTATLKRLCPDGVTGHGRAVLRATAGGFLVTIDGADVGTVLTADAAYAASRATGDIEVDALIAKRTDGARGFKVHLAVEMARPAPE